MYGLTHNDFPIQSWQQPGYSGAITAQNFAQQYVQGKITDAQAMEFGKKRMQEVPDKQLLSDFAQMVKQSETMREQGFPPNDPMVRMMILSSRIFMAEIERRGLKPLSMRGARNGQSIHAASAAMAEPQGKTSIYNTGANQVGINASPKEFLDSEMMAMENAIIEEDWSDRVEPPAGFVPDTTSDPKDFLAAQAAFDAELPAVKEILAKEKAKLAQAKSKAALRKVQAKEAAVTAMSSR